MIQQSERNNIDPVCGMKVDPARAGFTSTHKGRTYYFCAEQCKRAFDSKPDHYIKPKGFFGRFLERLAKTNEKTFGSGGPSCCH
jgi:YHS domain-containing protein